MSSSPTALPYGLWSSPLTTKTLAGQLRLIDVCWADAGACLLWLEGRSGENILVAQEGDDAPSDLISSHSAHGGVGYGGGEFSALGRDVFFAEKDGRLYKTSLHHGEPKALTPPHGSVASPTPSPDGQWVAYVHTDGHTDTLAYVDTQGDRWPAKLAHGADFYMQPTWSSASDRVAWVCWNHPQMPWDGTRLETRTITDNKDCLELGETQCWAGGPAESVQQPSFSPDGARIAYTSDKTGFAQIYVRAIETGEVTRISTEGLDHATPAWIQGRRTFCWANDGQSILAIQYEAGSARLVRYGLDASVEPIPLPSAYTMLEQITSSGADEVALLASGSQTPPRVITLNPSTGQVRVRKRATGERVPQEALARMEAVHWSAEDGTQVWGNYYAPTNPNFTAHGPPPLLVMIHGGPTTQYTSAYDARAQFFATRGFAVLGVNYRGSTGYGREYMDALKGQWGILDVEDAMGGAQHLVDTGRANADKLVIMGGSAGGYTVFQALTDYPGFFAAGISMYGITNLFSLTASTHKFESHYNDSLLGVLPRDAQLFRDRSPFFKAHKLTDPIAIFQGAKDVVVPKDQADVMVQILKSRDVPHVYHVYEDEGHGWRKAETIDHFYSTALSFLTTYVVYS